jgi:hypothetical protein
MSLRPRRGGVWLAWLSLLLAVSTPAFAHKSSDSYLRLEASSSGLAGQWDIALRDLDVVLGLDADGDGQLTWGEVRARRDDIAALAFGALQLQTTSGRCTPRLTDYLVDQHSDGAYAVLRFAAPCAGAEQALDIGYSLLADVDAGHRGLLQLSLGGAIRTAVLVPAASATHFSVTGVRRWDALRGYLRTGVDHIWSGYDHLLFLLSLLLPAVLWRARGGEWQPQPRLRSAFAEVCRVVTAFTVAHSITLALSTYGVVHLPSRWSESAIALSVVLAALNNIVPLVSQRRWLVAFAFGLIHGFGFANVLAELGLPTRELALALVGFNLGVEAGQLAIVAAFLPLAWLLRNTLTYRRVLVSGGSLTIAIIGALWLTERALNLQFLPVH